MLEEIVTEEINNPAVTDPRTTEWKGRDLTTLVSAWKNKTYALIIIMDKNGRESLSRPPLTY